MKTRALFSSIAALAASMFLSVPATAAMIAGWDFSQYFSDGVLITDGGTFDFTNTLDANYSNLDPTFGAGAESANFGRMFINGEFGSSVVTPTGFNNEQFLPTAGSLATNLSAPGAGFVEFDSLSVLQFEGQSFSNYLAMTAQAPVQAVFAATLNPAAYNGSDWSVSFAGRTFSGTSSVGVEFSTDGVTYSPAGSADLTIIDTRFSVNLGAVTSPSAFVRLNFSNANGQPIIDNLAINGTLTVIPEPGTALLIVSGLAGLQIFGRRRA